MPSGGVILLKMSREGNLPLDEIELVDRARHGDVPAYEELVSRYQEIAFRTAFVTTRDSETAQDAAQLAFIKAYYALKDFRVGAPFRAWLLKIVTNEARNQMRSTSRRGRYEFQLANDPLRDTAAPSPEEAAQSMLSHDVLLRAVNSLSERDQLAITYRYFLDFSEVEMAAALGCARGTVKSRLSRALSHLREALVAGNCESNDGTPAL